MRYIFKESASYVITLIVKQRADWFPLGLFRQTQLQEGVNLHFSVQWCLEACANFVFNELVVFKRLETVRTDVSFDYSFGCVCFLIVLSLSVFPCNLFKSRIISSVYISAAKLLIFSCLFIKGCLKTGPS